MAASSNSSLSGSSVSSGEFQPGGRGGRAGSLVPCPRPAPWDGWNLPVAALPALSEWKQASGVTLVWLASTLGAHGTSALDI